MAQSDAGDSRPAVAITGMGVVSAYGCDAGRFYRGLLDDRQVIEAVALPRDPEGRSAWWSMVRDFNPGAWMEPRVIDGTDVLAQWTIAAAAQALRQSGLQPDPLRTAVVQGTSMSGVQSLMRAQHEIDRHGPAAFPRKTMMKALSNMGAAQITMLHGLHGPSLTISTACASSIDAIGIATGLIASGRADTAIVGGTEAGHSLISGAADAEFIPAMVYAPAMFGMQSPSADPRRACMPFDAGRSGIVTSEGSAAFVLERADLAAQRGAAVFGYVRGYGSIADAFHPSAPEPSGRWEAQAMRLALEDAGLAADEVDALYAHATGTPVGDTPEIRAINSVYGGRSTPLAVTSIKGHFGHAAAASGGLSLVAALLAMAEGRVVHTANTSRPDPEIAFDVVLGKPRDMPVGLVGINAFGFGGQNAALLVSRAPPGPRSATRQG
ncbi:MAG: beta-ketoacyl-[acyl-carrier-protein] synthase family protein [Gammaproteobacteria bacterium]|nr:beta-ketoacyl-[acyl-carrier-protein] synthase family protein [Gammaproteobacteria bacterium]